MKDALTMSTFAEYDEVAAGESHDVHVSLHLEARARQAEFEGPPMSVLFVLDISSSMRGEPLRQVVEAVDFIIDLLKPTDRVGVMTFAAEAHEVISVEEADSEHLRRLRRRLRDISYQYGTNFEVALEQAGQMMPRARDGERQVVLFLSDGEALNGERTPSGLIKIMERWPDGISMSTLGFARHHDAGMLRRLSDARKGKYHFVSDPLVCEFEFASALGTQQAVVASDVEVVIKGCDGVEVLEVLGDEATRDIDGELFIDVSDLAEEGRRLLVIRLCVDAPRVHGPKRLAEITLRYHDEALDKGGELRLDVDVVAGERSGPQKSRVVADKLAVGADEMRKKAREFVGQGQYAGAATWLARMIAAIEDSPVYEGDDGSVLSEICENLRDEFKLIDEEYYEEHRNYTSINTAGAYDGVVNRNTHTLSLGLPRRFKFPGGSGKDAVVGLVFERGELAGRKLPIRGEMTVGRSRRADIVVEDEAVSRRHLQFLVYGDKRILRDLASQNGTYVNGERVLTSRVLDDGDRIAFGDVIARVVVG